MKVQPSASIRFRSGIMLGLLAAALALGGACGSDESPVAESEASESAGPTLLESVPASTTALASVDLKAVIEDEDIAAIFDKVAPSGREDVGSLDAALEEARKETGIDPRLLDRAFLFLTGTGFSTEFLEEDPTEADITGGVFLEGVFDQEALLTSLEEGRTELSSSMHGGVEIHVDSDEEMAIAFLTDGLALVGDPRGVRTVIDVRGGEAEALSGDLLEGFEKLGTPMAKLALQVPPGSVSEALEGGLGEASQGAPIDLSAFEGLRLLGASIEKAADEFSLNATLTLADAQSATEAADGLSGLLSFYTTFGADPETQQILDKLDISSSEDTVGISFEFTVDEIQRLTDSLEEGPFSPPFGG